MGGNVATHYNMLRSPVVRGHPRPYASMATCVWSGAGDVMWYVMSFTRYGHRLRPLPSLARHTFHDNFGWLSIYRADKLACAPCPALMPVINVFCQLISVWRHCCASPRTRCTHCAHTNLCKYIACKCVCMFVCAQQCCQLLEQKKTFVDGQQFINNAD